MGSQFRNSRVSIEVKITSYTFRNNAKQGFLIKKRIKIEKKYQNPTTNTYMRRRARKCKLMFTTSAW
jgi:hypothetical protein